MSAVATIQAFAADSGIYALMTSRWSWPIAESLHFIGLSLLFGCIGVVDLRLLGFAKGVAIADLHKITRWGVLGFAINAVTGFGFFVSAPDQYLYNPSFQLKALSLLIAGANMLAFYTFAWPRVRAARAGEVPLAAKVCAAISLSAWMGVITFGRLLTFFRPPSHWCFWCSW
jgi:hypothetical protein